MSDAPPPSPHTPAEPLSVLLVAPAEAADLRPILQSWLDELGKRPVEFEILLLVEAGNLAADSQAETLRGIDSRVHVVHHLAPPGFGPTLQTGLWLARHPLVLVAPCDGQYQPADMDRFFTAINLATPPEEKPRRVDLVAGYRVFGKVPLWLRAFDLLKRLGERILLGVALEPRESWLGWSGYPRRWSARHIYGVRVRDAECPFRLYRRDLFRRIPIQSRGAFAQVEILAKANHVGCLMTEVPVAWTPPSQQVTDPTWSHDAKTVFHTPDFGPAKLS